MLVGIPVSQLLGVFQGRSERVSSSVVAQPIAKKTVNAAKATSRPFETIFIVSILIHDLIAFKDVFLLPFRHDVGDRAVRFDTSDSNLGHELAIAVDEHARIRN